MGPRIQILIVPIAGSTMTSILAFHYNAEGHDQEVDITKPWPRLGKSQLLWLDGNLDNLRTLKNLPADMKTALEETPGGSSLEIFDGFYRFVIPSASGLTATKRELLTFIVGKGWLITVSKPRPKFMDSFIETDRGETLNGRLTPSAFAVALLTELLDVYRTQAGAIDAKIDTLDDAILTSREKEGLLKTLASLRRQVSALRSGLDETANTLHALMRPDFYAHIDASDQTYFEGLGRTLERLQDSVSNARDTVIGSFELYTTRVAQDTNKLVKALTIVTVITGVVGATAGIFGMNFDTPFFHTGISGFSYVTGAMIGASVAMVVLAIWRKWF